MGKYSFDAVIFDLDGVITQTAKVHASAWKMAFDEYMKIREERDGEPFKEFTHDADYLPYVDGKPRYEGVKSFLESRGINIDFGDPSDEADKETVCGIGNRKNERFRAALEKEGVEVFDSSVALIKKLRANGIRIGVASSSKNCQPILQKAGLEDLFETRVDGVVSAEIGLRGKPEGDIFVTAARNVDCFPPRSVVVEDATSGVAAGRNGGFGLVLGIARNENQTELINNGADLVVTDLSEISIEGIEEWFERTPKPLFESWDSTKEYLLKSSKAWVNPCCNITAKSVFGSGKKLIFFLDYDGTLTPIVSRPELAVMDEAMREVVKELSKKHMVAVVSGRMREDVEDLVKINDIFYAGSHGFDIIGPGFTMVEPRVKELIPTIDEIIAKLKKSVGDIEGCIIEEKKYSVAVHYRLVDEDKFLGKITEEVNKVISDHKELKVMSGKKVFEILPDIDWDKGKAIRWIVEALGISWVDDSVFYIGDDTTDEYAFRAIRTRGTPILVAKESKPSSADFQLSTPDDVKKLFEKILASS